MVSIALAVGIALYSAAMFAQNEVPAWCRALPRAEFKDLQRVPLSQSWFEVYAVANSVLAIYEPHQAEETIQLFDPSATSRRCASTPEWESAISRKSRLS